MSIISSDGLFLGTIRPMRLETEEYMSIISSDGLFPLAGSFPPNNFKKSITRINTTSLINTFAKIGGKQ